MLGSGGITEAFGADLTIRVVGNDAVVQKCKTTATGELVIPENYKGYPVTSIDAWAFENCRTLKSVTIPDSVTDIGIGVFRFCKGLTKVKLSNSLKIIPQWAFYSCSGLDSISIPNSVTEIGKNAFQFCYNLKSLNLGDGMTSIGGVFRSCTSLETVIIPDGVISIANAFQGCTSLMNVSIPNSVTIIRGAFGGCTSLENVIIPDGVTSIEGTFMNCTNLKSVKIPASVTNIDSAFADCSSLEKTTIPEGIKSIGVITFLNCSNLKSITIPDSVKLIYENAFKGCKSLSKIIFKGNAPTLRAGVFEGVPYDDSEVIVNSDAVGFTQPFGGLFVRFVKKPIKINTFSKSATPFSLNFESKSGSTYLIEASHDLKKWGEIGEVQGTGSSVEFTDWREALFQKQYYRLRLVE